MIELLKNKFEITRQIGKGGMAHIYYGIGKEDNKEYAIKILEPSSKNDITKQKRFSHELRLLKKINSPYVVRLYGGEMNRDHSYILMEYVQGDILKNYIKNRTRLTVDEAIEFSKQLTLGFAEIHKNNIVHRDIKSQNIMVTSNGQIKIIDFGIAIDEESEDLTKTNMLIGSPQYISPELINQDAPSEQSDVYALGIILYEMLAGEVPFTGKDTIDILRKHQNKEIPRISSAFSNIPQSVENIITKATAKKSANRYKNMQEFYLDLQSCLDVEKVNVKRLNFNNKKKKNFTETINSKWTLLIISSLVAILALIMIIVFSIGDFN